MDEVYAAGLNAFNQLTLVGQETKEEPNDIEAFTCVLRDVAIRCIHASFSYTLGQ